MHFFNKKGWIFLGLILLLILISVFTLPLQSNVGETVRFSTTPDALFRQLRHDSTWHNWWPGETKTTNQKSIFKQGQFTYTVGRILSNKFELKTTSDFLTVSSSLWVARETKEVTLTMTTNIALPYNPLDRIKSLFFSYHLKASYKEILTKLSQYYSLVKNLYNLDIHESNVEVEYITTQAQTFSHHPSVKEIYSLIDQVKNYIKNQGGTEVGFPMLHVSEISASEFFTQVGIPTNKKLSDSQKIKSKQMLKGGHILTAQVTGSQETINLAKKQMDFYIQDRNKVKVALSYEYLITNRLDQPDSNKWVTQLYFPII